MNTPENHHLDAAVWKKSTRSFNGNNCVEIAHLDTAVAVRDSKDRPGPALTFDPARWTEFIAGVQDGEFDR